MHPDLLSAFYLTHLKNPNETGQKGAKISWQIYSRDTHHDKEYSTPKCIHFGGALFVGTNACALRLVGSFLYSVSIQDLRLIKYPSAWFYFHLPMMKPSPPSLFTQSTGEMPPFGRLLRSIY